MKRIMLSIDDYSIGKCLLIFKLKKPILGIIKNEF